MRTPQNKRRPSKPCKNESLPSYDVAILGDHGVGKSSTIQRLLTGKYTTEHKPTAADVYSATIIENDKRRCDTNT